MSAASPRWLRLTRSGDTVTGYQSADGSRWNVVGTVRLAGLPADRAGRAVRRIPGLLVRSSSQTLGGSSGSGAATLATAALRPRQPQPASAPGGGMGRRRSRRRRRPGTGFHQAAGHVTVNGSGDIAPYVAAGGQRGTSVEQTLTGAFVGLIAVIVVAAMFMTAEYRRGLIRVTFAASPRRGRVLAAKAVVIGSVAFLAGLAGPSPPSLAGERLLRSNGNYILPVSAFTEVRVVAGTAALLAVAAVLAARARRAAAQQRRGGHRRHRGDRAALPARDHRPARGSRGLAAAPHPGRRVRHPADHPRRIRRSARRYTPRNGYFPLAPWAGFAVLCGYTALAVGLARRLPDAAPAGTHEPARR